MPRYKAEQRTLEMGGWQIAYTWQRKAVKNYNLRVRRDGSIYVSTPTRTTPQQLEHFLLEKKTFLRGALARVSARCTPPVMLEEGDRVAIWGISHTVRLLKSPKTSGECRDGVLWLSLPHPEDAAARARAFWRFASNEVEGVLGALTAQYAPCFLPAGTPVPQITLRRMKGRWGSCFYTQNRICYNTHLIFAPQECAHFVACHELAHFKYHNHSAAFYTWLARTMPDHKALRSLLYQTAIPEIAPV